jgi:membrane protein
MLIWLRDRVWPPFKKSMMRWSSDDGTLLSAAMSFYAIFSIFPICLLLVAVFGFITRSSDQLQNRQEQFLQLINQNAGPWLAEQLRNLLTSVASDAKLGGPIGLLTLIFGAIGMFAQLEAMFDRIWDTKGEKAKNWLITIRTVIWDRVLAFLVLLGVGGLLLLLFLSNLTLSGIKSHVFVYPLGSLVWQAAQSLLAFGGNTVLLSIIYKVFPKARILWREAISAGALVAIIWQIGQYFLTQFLIGDHYSAYGIIGSFIAVILWFYYASAVVFFGVEFLFEISYNRLKKQSPVDFSIARQTDSQPANDIERA